MKQLLIQAPVEDSEFFDQLKHQGESVELFEVKRFEGLSEIVQVGIQITTALMPLLIAYFKERTERAKGRMVIINGRKIRMSGFSEEEIRKILREATSDDDDQ